MPWSTPTLRSLREQTRDYLLANLTGADAIPPNSRLRVLSDANAGLAHGAHLYLDWQARQFLPDTADLETLIRFANIYLGGQKPATYASGTVTVTGTNGTILPSGTQMAGAGGVLFETTEQVTVGDAQTSVAVRALTPGPEGNLPFGVSLSLTIAVAGVDSTASVFATSGGIGAESEDSLRDRVLFRLRQPPHGGSASDFIGWARAVPGVTRAWARQEAGIGTVTVRFMMDDDRPLGLPDAVDVEAVRQFIDPLRPVALHDLYVVAPVPLPISFKVRGLSRATASTQAAIEASVAAMFRQRSAPGGTMYRSWIDEAVSRAAGENHHEMDFVTTPMPSPGHIPILGTISYGP